MKKFMFLILIAAILISAYIDHINTSIAVVSKERAIGIKPVENITDPIMMLKVMTYNIHRGINANNDLDLDGIVQVIKKSGADIIALQEVERFSVRTGFTDQIKYIADKLSMNYTFGKSINILNGQYGIGILSKYPIEDYEVYKLPSVREQRILLRASLKVNEISISVYNTHLGLNQNERDMQIKEIIRISENYKNFLITGDFNSTMDKLAIMTAKLTDCGSLGDNSSKATYKNDGLNGRIDYIFASGSFEVKDYKVIESNASDHYAVLSALEFRD